MTVSAPCNAILSDQRRTGRLTNEEREQRTAGGRSIHWLESRLADWHALLTRFAHCFDRETLLDRDCDQAVEHAIAALDAGNGLEARALLLAYRERDALRDSEHRAGGSHVGAMHALLRRIGGALERAAVQIRGGR